MIIKIDGTIYYLLAKNRYISIPPQPAGPVVLGIGTHPSHEYDYTLVKMSDEQARRISELNDQILKIVNEGDSIGTFSRLQDISHLLSDSHPNVGDYKSKAEMSDPDYEARESLDKSRIVGENPTQSPDPIRPPYAVC